MNKITEFRGQYYFLSNFYAAPVTYDGLVYQNNEAAFQSMKLLNRDERDSFTTMKPGDAKKKGFRVNLRRDWEERKVEFMREICMAKFTQNDDLRAKLLATGNAELIEGNTWNDTF